MLRQSNTGTLKIRIITIIACCAAVIVLFFAVNPEHAIWMPKCAFKMITEYDCPGCGSGRAFHHFLHGRFGRAVRCNPILALAVPYILILIWLQYLGGRKRFARLYDMMTSRTVVWITLGIILLYWVVRNIR